MPAMKDVFRHEPSTSGCDVPTCDIVSVYLIGAYEGLAVAAIPTSIIVIGIIYFRHDALLSQELAEYLNDQDKLKHLRNEFFYPKMATLPHVDKSLVNLEEDSVYLCGNSLGLLPKATTRIMDEQFKKWAEIGVFGHLDGEIPWAFCDECCLDGVAKLVGAHPSEIAVMNGLTVNVHVLFTAFYKPTPSRHKILIESKAFPSDHYAIESQIRLKGLKVEDSMICLEPRQGEDILRTEDILSYIEEHGDSISIIFFSGVQYYTGQLFEIEKITAAGHAKGCLVGWDLAHAYANVPLKLHEWDVDFACWCSYKYGCTGAGGLAGAFVNERFAEDKRDRMLGWWSHKYSTRFIMDNVLDLDTGAAGYRISNPPIMLAVAVLGFLEVMEKTNLEELREKSIHLTGYLEFLIDHYFGANSAKDRKVHCEIMTPRDSSQRGCQLSLKFNYDIASVYKELVKRGVAVDKRYPYVIRVAPVHLYNNFTDVWRFVQILVKCVDELEKELDKK
uniref:Kynureninase n=2 Tax=Acrobeloides nanus TaxID=290746 RepID=A0A914DM43_9BILA